jgi:hypothetical protein
VRTHSGCRQPLSHPKISTPQHPPRTALLTQLPDSLACGSCDSIGWWAHQQAGQSVPHKLASALGQCSVLHNSRRSRRQDRQHSTAQHCSHRQPAGQWVCMASILAQLHLLDVSGPQNLPSGMMLVRTPAASSQEVMTCWCGEGMIKEPPEQVA